MYPLYLSIGMVVKMVDYIFITNVICYNICMNNLMDLVTKAKSDGVLISVDEALEELPSWDDFFKIFSGALGTRHISSYTFGTTGIDQTDQLTDNLDDLIRIVKDIHPGEFMSALSIIHFLNATDNEIPEDAAEFYKFFRENSKEDIPANFESLMVPTRHADPIDGIYIQCLGNTYWTAYYEDRIERFALKPGDIMIIPKGIEHSVESLTPRVGVSIAMAD